MLKTFFLLSFVSFAFLTGCSSSPTSPGTNSNNNSNPSDSYLPLTTGSTWTYVGVRAYTLTILGDTTYNGKSWKILNNSASVGVGFVRKDGTIYTQISPSGSPVAGEFIGLNEAPGSTWAWDISAGGVTNHYAYTNQAQGLTHTVLGKDYSNVIQVHLVYTASLNGTVVQSATGDYYYAKGIGMIDADLGSLGSSQLSSYSIK